jgi:DNA-binding MarR family transcriptional regulator
VATRVDAREILGCNCLRIRRTARRITVMYDETMAPTGLTVGQFGILAQLYGFASFGRPSVPAGTLAERRDLDPTTLSRTMKPLQAQGLIRFRRDPDDGRVRLIELTDAGEKQFLRGVPYWRAAQQNLDKLLGRVTSASLSDILDQTLSKIAA